MFIAKRLFCFFAGISIVLPCFADSVDDGIFIRLQMQEPRGVTYYVAMGGYIHNAPWYLPKAVTPEAADKVVENRLVAGAWTPWVDLKTLAGQHLHGRQNRAGGVAEFPNLTLDFITTTAAPQKRIIIELATAANEEAVVKRFEETFRGSLTSVLISPDLRRDAAALETASQMTERRLAWARAASGGRRHAPRQLIVQTGFWGPQRDDLMIQEAEVLWLLGFTTLGGQTAATRSKYTFREPGHAWVNFYPGVSREDIDAQMLKAAAAYAKKPVETNRIFNFSDEVVAPPLGKDGNALNNFRQWLRNHKIDPQALGVASLDDVTPIDTPDELRRRQKIDKASANRVFYYSSRFRQFAANERFAWLTEGLRKHLPGDPISSTLTADHPYFAGTGLGMGMGPNPAWGSTPLALDWFDLARRRSVDMVGIEDWMGLQYMYGPSFTWEGFQLMGFQAAIFRSAGRGALPIIAWITPSDEINLPLKSISALCQGAKNFFYWTYGPTATSTENYWSDLRGAYDGVVEVTRQLAAAESIILPGVMRPTKVALLYSISADLWQPYGYIHMLERRATYLALVHQQYLVDMLTEEDLADGRLRDYSVLYATDPNISSAAMAAIKGWVTAGGSLYGSCVAGSRNEFDEEVAGLAEVFGIEPPRNVTTQNGAYHIRGALNDLQYLDTVGMTVGNGSAGGDSFGALGIMTLPRPTGAQVQGIFKDGSAAATRHTFGRGVARYTATCPGLSYIKDARFAPRELKEQWPETQRNYIGAAAAEARAPRLLELSHAVVEAGVYDAPGGTALVLANFTYQPIEHLKARLPLTFKPRKVVSAQNGKIRFKASQSNENWVAEFETSLRLTDTLMLWAK